MLQQQHHARSRWPACRATQHWFLGPHSLDVQQLGAHSVLDVAHSRVFAMAVQGLGGLRVLRECAAVVQAGLCSGRHIRQLGLAAGRSEVCAEAGAAAGRGRRAAGH